MYFNFGFFFCYRLSRKRRKPIDNCVLFENLINNIVAVHLLDALSLNCKFS